VLFYLFVVKFFFNVGIVAQPSMWQPQFYISGRALNQHVRSLLAHPSLLLARVNVSGPAVCIHHSTPSISIPDAFHILPEPYGLLPTLTLSQVRADVISLNRAQTVSHAVGFSCIGYPGIPPNGTDRPQAAVKGVSHPPPSHISLHPTRSYLTLFLG
jgi:hypothetical protein